MNANKKSVGRRRRRSAIAGTVPANPAPRMGRKSWRAMPQIDIASLNPARNNGVNGLAVDETEAILFALALAVEQRDQQTSGHCQRLALISVALGYHLGMRGADLETLYRGGFLHDVGKVGIPDSILLKPGKLTADEWVVMRSHPGRGEEICRPMKSLAPVLPIIRHHHERWDGFGYPDGLRGEQIPIHARVLQIADIYDALISARPYKPAYTPDEALELLKQEADSGWRDPELVRTFIEIHKDLIPAINGYIATVDRPIENMRTSLVNLQRFLTVS
jgi:putative two-component system response regulator